ncbi:MAG: virulence RhuM family protein [Cystobacterineae bacterium]|nr:virulence RhuM family protein [Cystobacterineae bacterium]
MHWATHGHTAAELIAQRADAAKPLMGLQNTRPGGSVHSGRLQKKSGHL